MSAVSEAGHLNNYPACSGFPKKMDCPLLYSTHVIMGNKFVLTTLPVNWHLVSLLQNLCILSSDNLSYLHPFDTAQWDWADIVFWVGCTKAAGFYSQECKGHIGGNNPGFQKLTYYPSGTVASKSTQFSLRKTWKLSQLSSFQSQQVGAGKKRAGW